MAFPLIPVLAALGVGWIGSRVYNGTREAVKPSGLLLTASAAALGTAYIMRRKT
jgi:hypothetical protein